MSTKDNAAKPKKEKLLSILFVDDEESVLVSLKRLCRATGWNVFTASSGEQGLSIIEDQKIDLVVSDMRMPHMDGAEFLEQVAQNSPDTIRILLTGFSEIDSTIAAINKGKIYSYISKPWDNDELKDILKQALYTKELEAERLRLEKLTQRQNTALKELNNSLEEKVLLRTRQLQKTADALKDSKNQLENSYTASVEMFASLIEMRNEMASGNGRRVADIAKHLATVLKLKEDTVKQVYYAGLLHNIGKLSLPDELINVPYSKLNKNQKAAYLKHSVIGETLLMNIEQLKEAAGYIRHYQERFDGSGFPDKQRQNGISLGAQIIGIASYFDNLLNGLESGTPMSEEEVKQAIQALSGKWFNEKLVLLLIRELEEGRLSSHKSSDRVIGVEDLEEEMVLSRDLYAPNGMLLLPRGKKVESSIINKLIRFQEDAEGALTVHVYHDAEE